MPEPQPDPHVKLNNARNLPRDSDQRPIRAALPGVGLQRLVSCSECGGATEWTHTRMSGAQPIPWCRACWEKRFDRALSEVVVKPATEEDLLKLGIQSERAATGAICSGGEASHE